MTDTWSRNFCMTKVTLCVLPDYGCLKTGLHPWQLHYSRSCRDPKVSPAINCRVSKDSLFKATNDPTLYRVLWSIRIGLPFLQHKTSCATQPLPKRIKKKKGGLALVVWNRRGTKKHYLWTHLGSTGCTVYIDSHHPISAAANTAAYTAPADIPAW